MRKLNLLLFLFLLSLTAVSQKSESKKVKYTTVVIGTKEVNLKDLGYTRILLKDGTIKKNCIITEIGENGIVFIKDKVLHDLLIDRIKKIEFDEGEWYIHFETDHCPLLSRDYTINY